MKPTAGNPIALITGASRGLGKSMALHLAARGVDSILTYRDRADAAALVVAEIARAGRQSIALQLDVAKTDSFDAFISTVRDALASKWGKSQFDFLVNNGGTGAHASFLETTEATFDEMMLTHLKGPFFLTQKLTPLLADGGRIVNISSGLTRVSFPGSAAYAAMKGGLEVFTRYMARELAPRQITVNTLAPGAIATDFRGGAVRDNPELNKQVAAITALGRVGLADDIGGALALLLADESRWITGQRIEASGGMLL